MKDIVTVRGQEFERNTEPFNCIFCNHETGCSAWGCTSPACAITGECFGGQYKNVRICPFDDKYNSWDNPRPI